MSHYGNIKSYDANKGRGMISPEKGGEPIAFVKADLQQEAAEPKQGQRFGYETRQVDGAKPEAFNLQPQQGQREQASQQQG
ncbi:S1 domain-containing protein [Erythrobacter mangrovi]|uniref:Cold-shock protein n=1 Tax=Erythrobacter mangrovi TaxID=2739433 RepID=A0A7D4CDU1_9SPHN|nr:cold-shock protein [Erythrobacter mangrovi]QKG71949.1 cold-shock protein [Erythrobacter mangrovi]